MELKIANLGNLSKGIVNINRPLTIFCGPNNTGKTYVSYLIYSLLRPYHLVDESELLDIDQLLIDSTMTIELDTQKLFSFRKNRIKELTGGLEGIFGISSDDAERLFKDLKIDFLSSQNDFTKEIHSLSFERFFEPEYCSIKVSKEKGSSNITLEKKGGNIPKNRDFFFRYNMTTGIYNQLVSYPFVGAQIFPVERNSIYTFNKELSIQRNELIEQMQALKDNNRLGFETVDRLLGRSTRYPQAIRDCLNVANDMSHIQKTKSEYFHFAEEMEKSLLGGTLAVSKDGEMIFRTQSRRTMPIHMSASIVKTLASLFFYLKHIARNGELIIIDEPEMNLHPDAQVLLARMFARMINEGLFLLISTHSDYIIRELNNLITIGSLKTENKTFQTLEYNEKETLKSSDVGVYLFKHIRKGSMKSEIVPVEVSKDGFEVETIDNVIYDLNRTSDNLIYQLNEP